MNNRCPIHDPEYGPSLKLAQLGLRQECTCDLNNMEIERYRAGGMGAAGGGGGGGYSASTSFVTSFCGPSSYYPDMSMTPEEQKKLDESNKKALTEAEKRRQKEMDEWTLGKLPDYKKLKIMKITKRLLQQYYLEREVKKLMGGIKWFLFFLGLAVLFNFTRILDLVKFFIKH